MKKDHVAGEPAGGTGAGRGNAWLRKAGFALLILSALLWTAILAVPFLPLPPGTGLRVGIGAGLAIVGEAAFWIAALILGREVVRRYRRYLDPRTWWGTRERTGGDDASRRDGEPPDGSAGGP